MYHEIKELHECGDDVYDALDQLVEHAQQAYTRNERLNSLFVTQPTPVDCIIDDLILRLKANSSL